MSLDDVIYARLTSDPAIKALVKDRCFPAMAPQGVLFPCIVWDFTSDEAGMALDGETGMDDVGVRFYCMAQSRAEATAVRKALKARMKDWVDRTRAPSIEACSRKGCAHDFESAPDGDERGIHRKVQDYALQIGEE